jgi:hypothetical protein
MTRPELVNHIVGRINHDVQAAIAEAMKPLSEQLSGLQNNVATTSVQSTINRMKSENKDFEDWKGEMVALARTHPTLDVPDLYALARAQNPSKASTLSEKYNPPAPRPTRFGGLTPAMNSNANTPPLSRDDAGREAYREVQARFPGVLTALENM